MAALLRLGNPLLLRNICTNASRTVRLISTSPKKSETATISPTKESTATATAETKSHNWVSYGFDYRDEANDRSAMKATFFFSMTLCLVWGTFIWAYLPDPQLRDWAQREAYLVLREREAAGGDLISANYVDPSCMELPSDEELGDTEIII